MAPKICLYCGFQFPATTAFCPECGSSLEDAVRVAILRRVDDEHGKRAEEDTVSLRRTPGVNSCLYCRLQLPDSATFCPECGRPIERGYKIRPTQDCELDALREKMQGKDDRIRQKSFYSMTIDRRAYDRSLIKKWVKQTPSKRFFNPILTLS